MTATAHPPAARQLPVWLGMSLAIHAVALLGADALIDARPQPSPPLQKTPVMFAGRAVTPLPPQPEQLTPEAPAVSPPAPQRSRARYSRPAHRAGHDARTSARGATPWPQTPPSQTVGGSANRAPGTARQHSASAPEPGIPGATYAGPLAGGGSQVLTSDGGGPVGFQVATAGGGEVASARGGAPSGTVGGNGVSAGEGARGTGPGGGTGEGARATGSSSSPGGPGPGSRPAPQVRPAPTPDPPPSPKPSQADLSRFRSMVQARINGARRYPSSARDADQHGTVRVSFRVSPGGQPSGISVASSSGYQSLDTAARRAVSAAGPYRPFPKGMSSSIRVTATVVFRLN